jgi:tetratricopeptide (TPR) repeat protein
MRLLRRGHAREHAHFSALVSVLAVFWLKDGKSRKTWSLGLFFQLFPSALSVVGSLAFTPDNGDCVRLSPGARFRQIIPKLLRAARRIPAPTQRKPQRNQPPADPYAPARESWNKKDHDAAIASLDQILAATPTDVIALLMKGQVLLSSGRAREARDPLFKALDLDPENLGALETLAYAEGALNEHDRALACWRRLAVLRGLDESAARMIGNETRARDEQRRNSSAFKDLEEGCPPIEQCFPRSQG